MMLMIRSFIYLRSTHEVVVCPPRHLEPSLRGLVGFRAAAGGTPAGAAAADAAGAGGVAIGRRPGPEAVLRPRLLSGAAATLDDDFLVRYRGDMGDI